VKRKRDRERDCQPSPVGAAKENAEPPL
jgi:hypothetical protein